MSDKMFELADTLKELREAKRAAEDKVSEISARIEETDFALSELMAETETQSFNRAGTLFYLTNTTRASANVEKKDELYSTLKSNGFGVLIHETCNANSLSAFVKEQMSDNDNLLPDWLDGLVNIYEKVTVGVRKAK